MLLNGIQKGAPILNIIYAFIVCGASALSILVASNNSDLGFKATLGFLVVECCMCILIILGQMAMVYNKSKKLFKIMQCKQDNPGGSLRNHKWKNKLDKSCSAIKFRINLANFMDDFTPLNCLQH